jgi:hypothetical protein
MYDFLYVYLPFFVTVLFLISLNVVLWKIEKSCPNMKFLWLSSVVPLAIALGCLTLSLYKPYASHSLLNYLFLRLLWCEYPCFIIVGLVAPLLSSGWWFEVPVWAYVVFAVSFVLYTSLIFIVIRIVLYLKNKFWSGKALAPHQ